MEGLKLQDDMFATAVTPCRAASAEGESTRSTLSGFRFVNHSSAVAPVEATETPTANTSTPLLKMALPPRLLNCVRELCKIHQHKTNDHIEHIWQAKIFGSSTQHTASVGKPSVTTTIDIGTFIRLPTPASPLAFRLMNLSNTKR